MDEEIRGYERALQRAGKSPREVACALLGVKEPDRFLIVVEETRPWREGEKATLVAMPFGFERGDVQLPMERIHFTRQLSRGASIPAWWNGWSAPMLTVLEAAAWADYFTGRGYRWMLWDQRSRSRVFGAGMNASDVRPGWISEEERQNRLIESSFGEEQSLRALARSEPMPEPTPTGGGGDLTLPQAPAQP